MNRSTPDQVTELLSKWEDVYKKGQLSFWLLFLLHERPYYPYEIGQAIAQLTNGAFSVDDNSIYRAMSRFEGVGIVRSELRQSDSGPSRRYYHLTEKGNLLLAEFLRRNILIFASPPVSARIQAILAESPLPDNDLRTAT